MGFGHRRILAKVVKVGLLWKRAHRYLIGSYSHLYSVHILNFPVLFIYTFQEKSPLYSSLTNNTISEEYLYAGTLSTQGLAVMFCPYWKAVIALR